MALTDSLTALAQAVAADVKALTSGLSGAVVASEGVKIVDHGTNASVARPTAALVIWRGTAVPTNAAVGDWRVDA